MDIYGAEKHVKKLLAYVEGVADANPRMYTSTKDRLKDLASTCQQVVKTISMILEQKILEGDSTEFEDGVNSDVIKSLKSMQDEFTQLNEFVSTDPAKLNPIVHNKQKLSSSNRKHIISKYGLVLSELSSNCPYPTVSDCANLLWTWFNSRFFRCCGESVQFHYNIRRIPIWISDIVIAYGKHVDQNTNIQFCQEFYSWCESLSTCGSNNKFAVPYEIYQIDTNATPPDMSLTAVVIWDILFDSGLNHLCTADTFGVHPSEDMVYKRCSLLAPNILDNYRNYKDDISILAECNLVN